MLFNLTVGSSTMNSLQVHSSELIEGWFLGVKSSRTSTFILAISLSSSFYHITVTALAYDAFLSRSSSKTDGIIEVSLFVFFALPKSSFGTLKFGFK